MSTHDYTAELDARLAELAAADEAAAAAIADLETRVAVLEGGTPPPPPPVGRGVTVYGATAGANNDDNYAFISRTGAGAVRRYNPGDAAAFYARSAATGLLVCESEKTGDIPPGSPGYREWVERLASIPAEAHVVVSASHEFDKDGLADSVAIDRQLDAFDGVVEANEIRAASGANLLEYAIVTTGWHFSAKNGAAQRDVLAALSSLAAEPLVRWAVDIYNWAGYRDQKWKTLETVGEGPHELIAGAGFRFALWEYGTHPGSPDGTEQAEWVAAGADWLASVDAVEALYFNKVHDHDWVMRPAAEAAFAESCPSRPWVKA